MRGDPSPVGVEADDEASCSGELAEEPALGQQDGGPGVVEHGTPGARRVGRVERHVRAAGLEDAEHAHEPARSGRARHDADQHLGTDPEGPQVVGQPVRAAVRARRSVSELTVGDQRHGVGRSRRLRLEELGGRSAVAGSRPPGPGPRSSSSRRRSARGRAAGARRGAGRGRRRCPRAGSRSGRPSGRSSRRRTGRCCTRGPRRGRRGVSASARVRSNLAVPVPSAVGSGRRVSSGRPTSGIRLFWRTNITWKSGVRLGSRAGLQRLDELLEGQVLVLVGPQRDLADAAEQLAEARVARQVGPQRQHVHEEADQPLDLGAVPVGDRRADDDVVLAAVAVEQGLEGGQQRHEGRRALAPAERVERADSSARERERPDAPAGRPDGRARAVGGQLQGRSRPPAAATSSRAGGRGPRPAASSRCQSGVVGVLDRQLGQRRRAAPRGTPRRAPPARRRRRPSDQPSVTMWCIVRSSTWSSSAQPEQAWRGQRPAGQVERPPGLLGGQPRGLGLAVGRRRAAQVRSSSARSSRLGDDLHRARRRPSRTWSAAPRAAGRSRRSAARSASASSGPVEPDGGRHVEGRLAGRQLVEEPERLLRERERERPGRSTRAERRRGRPRSAAARRALLDARGQRGDGRAPRRASRSGSSTPKASRSREATWVASSEWPPSSKKSSCAPTRSQRRAPRPRSPPPPPRSGRAAATKSAPRRAAGRPRARAGPCGRPCRWASAAARRARRTPTAPCTRAASP